MKPIRCVYLTAITVAACLCLSACGAKHTSTREVASMQGSIKKWETGSTEALEKELDLRVRTDANVVVDYLEGRLSPLERVFLPTALAGRFSQENTWRVQLIEDLLVELEESGEIRESGRFWLAVNLGDHSPECDGLGKWERLRCTLLAAHQRLQHTSRSIYRNPRFLELFGESVKKND